MSAGWDVIDDEDVIGTASARLLSTCTDRGDRLAALSLLGLLLDHADEAGRTRLPLDTLASELDVEPERVVRLLQRLLAVEAVRTEGGAVVVVGSPTSDPPLLRPSRFLANLAAVLEREPSLVPSGVAGEFPRAAGATAFRTRPAFRRRVLAALGVGLAAMVLSTTPSGDPRSELRSLTAPANSAGRAPWATRPVPRNTAAPVPAVAGADQPAPEDPVLAPAEQAASPVDAGGRSGQVQPARGAGGDGADLRPVSPRPPATPTAPRVDVGVPGPDRPRPVLPTPTTRPDRPTPPDAGLTCPSGPPRAVVSASEVLVDWPASVLDPVGDPILLVTGTVSNTTEAEMRIETIEVGTGNGADRVVEFAGPVPVTIGPGDSADWEAKLVLGLVPVAEPVADVQVAKWSWTDPDLAGCAT
ncbi:MAG TPA: hypothetical protein VGV93_00520 [Acidimicrobiales bacterium]|nr:hypothetical protein [Acidimicrobiales bacterium]